MSFDQLGLSPAVLQAVADAGYTEPTPIQQQAIPWVLMGRDVLGCAQTGTGKTAGFTLPMIDVLASGRARARMPRSLILEPTRELAAQVAENFDVYGKYNKLSMALLIGGVSFDDQERVLDRGVDVLIATPGRLIDHFERGKVMLNDVKILVIDEADRMLDMGFIPDVERIVSMMPRIRQTLFFSATMPPEIRRLADAFLMNPKEVTVSRPATTATTVTQGLAVVDEMDKREALRRLILKEEVRNALVFCNRKRDVDILYKSLKRHGFNVGALHGDMSQPVRTETLERFKNNEMQLLVASDVAARGLDIDDMSHVFNFDVPIHADDYVHRIGRTGRAGRSGIALTLATQDDAEFVAAIEKLIGSPIPRIEVPDMVSPELEAGDGSKRRRRGRGGERRSGERSSSERPSGDRRPERPRRERRPRQEPDVPREQVAETVAPVVTAAPEEAAPPPVREVAPLEARPERRSAESRRDGDRRRSDNRRSREDGASQAARPARDERRDQGRGGPGREDHARDNHARDSQARDRNPRGRSRDNDLGPPVVGMGDHMPAFLLTKVPAHLARNARPQRAEEDQATSNP